MTEKADKQAATLHGFISAWKQWDAEKTISTFANEEGFRQVTMPFRMNMPARTRIEVQHTLPFLERAVKNYQVEMHRVLHDREKGEAAVYAISKGETPFGEWKMEYAVFITFDESGDKIMRLEEMLDSAHASWFGPHFQNWMQEQKNV